MQPLKQVKDTAGSGLVQVACRFVSQQQLWIANQRTGKRDSLLLAAGKFTRPMVAPFLQTNLP